jgi:hypothetical protein
MPSGERHHAQIDRPPPATHGRDLLHWLIALGILALIGIGLAMTHLGWRRCEVPAVPAAQIDRHHRAAGRPPAHPVAADPPAAAAARDAAAGKGRGRGHAWLLYA